MSKHKPATREEFKEFCLRKLGKPIINIDVTDDMVEDAVEQALSYFIEYHFAGSQPDFFKHVLTQTDIDNKYITIDNSDNIAGIWRIFPFRASSGSTSTDIFSVEYQLVLNTIHNISSFSMAPYYSTRMKYSQIEEILVGQVPMRFNRSFNKLYFDVDRESLAVGDYLVAECFISADPDVQTDIWSERIFQEHCTALIKLVWGASLSKFEGVQLPGGMTLNGLQIYDSAYSEIEAVKDEYARKYTMPPLDIIM